MKISSLRKSDSVSLSEGRREGSPQPAELRGKILKYSGMKTSSLDSQSFAIILPHLAATLPRLAATL